MAREDELVDAVDASLASAAGVTGKAKAAAEGFQAPKRVPELAPLLQRLALDL
jgi:hypothetical protein